MLRCYSAGPLGCFSKWFKSRRLDWREELRRLETFVSEEAVDFVFTLDCSQLPLESPIWLQRILSVDCLGSPNFFFHPGGRDGGTESTSTQRCYYYVFKTKMKSWSHFYWMSFQHPKSSKMRTWRDCGSHRLLWKRRHGYRHSRQHPPYWEIGNVDLVDCVDNPRCCQPRIWFAVLCKSRGWQVPFMRFLVAHHQTNKWDWIRYCYS